MAPVSQLEIAGLLRAWTEGDRGAMEKLIPLVDQDLHRMAKRQMRGERDGPGQ